MEEALASQGFESPYLQTPPPRLASERLRLASQTSPRQAQLRRSLSDEASWSFKRQGVVGLLCVTPSPEAPGGYVWQAKLRQALDGQNSKGAKSVRRSLLKSQTTGRSRTFGR